MPPTPPFFWAAPTCVQFVLPIASWGDAFHCYRKSLRLRRFPFEIDSKWRASLISRLLLEDGITFPWRDNATAGKSLQRCTSQKDEAIPTAVDCLFWALIYFKSSTFFGEHKETQSPNSSRVLSAKSYDEDNRAELYTRISIRVERNASQKLLVIRWIRWENCAWRFCAETVRVRNVKLSLFNVFPEYKFNSLHNLKKSFSRSSQINFP